jgi:hypothetical protein
MDCLVTAVDPRRLATRHTHFCITHRVSRQRIGAASCSFGFCRSAAATAPMPRTSIQLTASFEASRFGFSMSHYLSAEKAQEIADTSSDAGGPGRPETLDVAPRFGTAYANRLRGVAAWAFAAMVCVSGRAGGPMGSCISSLNSRAHDGPLLKQHRSPRRRHRATPRMHQNVVLSQRLAT